MAKKSSIMGYLYAIGMAVTAIGFCVPIFKLSGFFGGIAKGIGKISKAFGGRGGLDLINGFSIVSSTNDTVMKIAALLVFIGALAGLVISFLNIKKNKELYKLIALIVSVAAGLYMFFNTSDYDAKFAANYLFIGFYMIIAGWIIAFIGWYKNR